MFCILMPSLQQEFSGLWSWCLAFGCMSCGWFSIAAVSLKLFNKKWWPHPPYTLHVCVLIHKASSLLTAGFVFTAFWSFSLLWNHILILCSLCCALLGCWSLTGLRPACVPHTEPCCGAGLSPGLGHHVYLYWCLPGSLKWIY